MFSIRCGLYQYIDAIEGFSRRRLTVETDALWAFTGVMRAFLPQFQDGFVWGLPAEYLDAALLWFPERYRDPLDGPRTGLHAAIVDSHMIRLPFPTWSWASWRGKVEYDAKCEEEIKGEVEWHEPARYAVNIVNPLSEPWYQAGACETLSSVQSSPSCHVIMDDRALGFLRFTAASMTLHVEVSRPASSSLQAAQAVQSEHDCTSGPQHGLGVQTHELLTYCSGCMLKREWISCDIRTAKGKSIGFIWVPMSWLGQDTKKQGEFILLSTRIEQSASENCPESLSEGPEWGWVTSNGIKHIDSCEHQMKYNVMLVEWKEGPHCRVAKRISIAQIDKRDWAELESSRKQIVLG
jgi:hypothetical protein